MRVLVTGSHGLIGSALFNSLERDRHDVVRLVRPGSTVAGATLRWDLGAGTIDPVEGFDAVVHLAGEGIAERRWSSERKQRILESRTIGTSLLANALASATHKPRVLVSASGIGFYGDRGDEPLTETSAAGDRFTSDVVRQWEAAAIPAADAGIRVAYARTGIVLDAHGGALQKMLLPFKLGLGGRLGSGKQYMSWITLHDEVAAIRFAIDTEALVGPVNLVAPNPVTNQEFVTTLGRVLRRPTVLPTPLVPLKLRYGAELVQTLLLDSQRVVPQALLGVGFTFAFPQLESALQAVLA